MFQLGREEPICRQAGKSSPLRQKIATIFWEKFSASRISFRYEFSRYGDAALLSQNATGDLQHSCANRQIELHFVFPFPCKFQQSVTGISYAEPYTQSFRQMLNTMIKQEMKLSMETERPKQPVVQDKSGIYQVKAQSLNTPLPTPIRPQHFVHVQQYYTGDA
jgi:hypothetical protein